MLATSAIARMNLLLHGVEHFKIVREHTLRDPAFYSGNRLPQFDCVVLVSKVHENGEVLSLDHTAQAHASARSSIPAWPVSWPSSPPPLLEPMERMELPDTVDT